MSTVRNPFILLPQDILFLINLKLLPEEIAKLAMANKFMYSSLLHETADPLWKIKYKLYFPDSYAALSEEEQLNTTGWCKKFLTQYYETFNTLPDAGWKNIFELIIEGDDSLMSVVQAVNNSTTLHPVFAAIKLGHLPLVQKFIEQNPEWKELPDRYGQTPLLWAASLGHTHIVSYLISLKVDLDVQSIKANFYDYGKTPLYWALQNGHDKAAVLLINEGADLTKKATTPLDYVHLAAKHGCLESLKALLKKNPKLLDKKDADGISVLSWAATRGHLHVVKYLYEQLKERDPKHEVQAELKEQPLRCAALSGHDQVVDFFLNEGTNPNPLTLSEKRKSHQDHVIFETCKKGHLGVIKVLVQHDPKCLTLTQKGQTPLHYAAINHRDDVVRYLIKVGANPLKANATPFGFSLSGQNQSNQSIGHQLKLFSAEAKLVRKIETQPSSHKYQKRVEKLMVVRHKLKPIFFQEAMPDTLDETSINVIENSKKLKPIARSLGVKIKN